MANNLQALSKRFAPSTETLPPSDPRDAAIKSLNAKCRDLIEIAHSLQSAERDLDRAKYTQPIDVEVLTSCAVSFGTLEEKFFNLKETIESEHRHYVQDLKFQIFLVHTESGMPIRVNDRCKKPIWA